MTSPAHAEPLPSALLARLATEAASGELICAGDGHEIHVFLQRGRVAWAISASARLAFRKHLIDHCGVSPQALSELVAECRRLKRPVGETLVRWGLATQAQVREALAHQVKASLEQLHGLHGAHTLFLPREAAYAEYDATLTFSLDEVSPSGLRQQLGAAPASAALRWVELSMGNAVVSRVPTATKHPPKEWARLAAEPGVHLVVLRDDDAAILGLPLREPGSALWLAFHSVQELTSVLPTVAALPCTNTAPELWRGAPAESGALDGARAACAEMFEGAPELHGLFLVSPRTRWGLARPALALDASLERVGAWSALLAGGTHAPDLPWCSKLVALVTADGWWFGTPVPFGGDASVWTLVDGAADPGMGWLLLGSAARRLAAIVDPGKA